MQFSGQSHYLFQIVSKFPKVKLSVLLPAGVLRHAKQQRYIGHITGLFPVGSSWDGFDLNCVLLSVGENTNCLFGQQNSLLKNSVIG